MAVYRIFDDGKVIPEGNAYVAPAPPAGAAPAPAAGGAALPAPIGFTPIGKGRPLNITIRHVYTGQYPKLAHPGQRLDMAVVSGVRNFDVFQASARALNFVKTSVQPCSHFTGPDAFSDGTTLVAYSPAVLTDSISLTIQLAVANFSQAFLQSLSGALGAVAGIPLLMPYAGWLIGGGQILNLGGEIGHALMDGPVFTVNETLNFDLPGAPPAHADFRVLANNTEYWRPDLFDYKDGVGLVDLTGKPYAGEQPYVVISLDGKKNDQFNKFAPTVASSDILQRFFDVKDGQKTAIDTVVEGLSLASDMKYRRQAEHLLEEIAAAAGDAEETKRLQEKLKAVRNNILTPALKPALPT